VEIELIVIFFGIALIYASVGFGGGSSYLAVLALFFLEVPVIKITALICNIAVVTGSTIQFSKAKTLNWKKIFPLIFTSVPMAFVGAAYRITDDAFFVLLGLSLMIAAIIMLIGRVNSNANMSNQTTNVTSGIIGGLIGLLSGLVGIGGGIFLSPVLNFMKWDHPKAIAGCSAVFILVNSISGLLGQASKGIPAMNFFLTLSLVLAVTFGGLIGSRIGIFRLFPRVIINITAILVMIASLEILAKHTQLFRLFN